MILQVNNAGASGVIVDEDSLRAMKIDPASWVNMLLSLLLVYLSTFYKDTSRSVIALLLF